MSSEHNKSNKQKASNFIKCKLNEKFAKVGMSDGDLASFGTLIHEGKKVCSFLWNGSYIFS